MEVGCGGGGRRSGRSGRATTDLKREHEEVGELAQHRRHALELIPQKESDAKLFERRHSSRQVAEQVLGRVELAKPRQVGDGVGQRGEPAVGEIELRNARGEAACAAGA